MFHFSALHNQTGESGVLVGGNCQPSVDQLDVHDPFEILLTIIKKSFEQLTEIVVKMQLLHSEMLMALYQTFPLEMPIITS